ncbi:hypothetical protein KC332_g8891 [Hortaea werneckii]|nr:hypothetical protein KC358_g8250 [Hortaea werneckii]KAI6830380.1 hypothetical protein KC350_g7598 [Hortaea werneckii]KAI6926764.1 hypothetical protein KC348_g8573 [Hortaea werneckii]KAI6932866.1 hypothetical protein KC341_g8716 [Hortaea werneckii]KAI6957972.1 hypothetical protein KC321_g14275 [Hortaea werneckii]
MHCPSIRALLLLPLVSRISSGQDIAPFTEESAVKFDNLDAETGLGRSSRSLDSLGAYSLLYYDNLAVVNITPEVAGLKPFSRPNVLGYDTKLFSQGQQIMTSEFDDSITDYFDLKFFYFGCVLANVSYLPSIPIPCSLTVTGLREKEQVAEEIFLFESDGNPSNLAGAYPSEPGFKNVTRVTFDIMDANRGLDFAVLFDNFEYEAILKQGASYEG